MAGTVNPIEIQKFLKGVNYPCSKQDLVAKARREGADQNVVSTLERLPDQPYNGPAGVSEAIGRMR